MISNSPKVTRFFFCHFNVIFFLCLDFCCFSNGQHHVVHQHSSRSAGNDEKISLSSKENSGKLIEEVFELIAVSRRRDLIKGEEKTQQLLLYFLCNIICSQSQNYRSGRKRDTNSKT